MKDEPSGANDAGGRVRTVFIGSGAFGVPSLRLVARLPSIDLVAVVTAPARRAGRRQELTPSRIPSRT